jgi:CheY-like chemotaxis protein
MAVHKKKLILALDDGVTNLHQIRKFLEDLYDIALAKDADVAIKILNGVNVDLLLLDLEMPEISGFDFMRRIKADPKTRDIPVIFLSSNGVVETVSEAARLGAKGFIQRPIYAKVLRGKVAQLFEKQEEEMRLAAESAPVLEQAS